MVIQIPLLGSIEFKLLTQQTQSTNFMQAQIESQFSIRFFQLFSSSLFEQTSLLKGSHLKWNDVAEITQKHFKLMQSIK